MSRRAGLALALTALALGGCGLGAGDKPAGTTLTVTRDFGRDQLRRSTAPRVAGSETVMRLLGRNAKITTRYGGGFVQSIDGLTGGERDGRPVDWFFYVNGVESRAGAAAVKLKPGDRVWWDNHDWSETQTIPAVVGSFPEPFVHGLGGRRLPVRVECQDPRGDACSVVSQRLAKLGVPVARGGIRAARVERTLRLVVAPLSAIGEDPSLSVLRGGPRTSGVYVRTARDGRSFTTLDPAGQAVVRHGAGDGLIAAVRSGGDEEPVWAVTGVDTAGVERAAQAFGEAALRNRFAVLVTPAGARGLPETGR